VGALFVLGCSMVLPAIYGESLNDVDDKRLDQALEQITIQTSGVFAYPMRTHKKTALCILCGEPCK